MRKITKEILDKMINDYHSGTSLIELSEKYDFQPQTIQRHFKKMDYVFQREMHENFQKKN